MTRTVLIVDDDASVAKAVRIRLEAAGYAVFHAENGLAGIEAAAECRPDVILLDVNMPGVGGFEVRRALASEPELARIPVVFLTAYALESARTQPYDPTANVFISKPFESAALLGIIERACQHIQV